PRGSSPPAVRSATSTLAPSWRNAATIARPIPRDPPVTITFLSSNLPTIASLLACANARIRGGPGQGDRDGDWGTAGRREMVRDRAGRRRPHADHRAPHERVPAGEHLARPGARPRSARRHGKPPGTAAAAGRWAGGRSSRRRGRHAPSRGSHGWVARVRRTSVPPGRGTVRPIGSGSLPAPRFVVLRGGAAGG